MKRERKKYLLVKLEGEANMSISDSTLYFEVKRKMEELFGFTVFSSSFLIVKYVSQNNYLFSIKSESLLNVVSALTFIYKIQDVKTSLVILKIANTRKSVLNKNSEIIV